MGGLLGTAVGLAAGYAYAFMRYGEQGLWVSQFALFLASGALMLAAATFYQRYSPMLLGDRDKEGES